jgi:hypothetical protein
MQTNNQHGTRREFLAGSASAALVAAQQQAPPIRTRMFWTWDHSTEWVPNRGGAQTLGASNFYGRQPAVFLEDYTRLLGWCGEHQVDAVVVWGLLRDTHGGIDAARRLCEVAVKKNVRLICGVGLNAYGGVYYEGDSPFALELRLVSQPDLYGVDEKGRRMLYNFGVNGPRPSHHACPSRSENQDFAAESLRWLFKTLPQLGGVQIETGDTGVCRCARCESRRRHPVSQFSWEDMALMYPIAADAIRSVSNQAWIVCETYSHPEPSLKPGPAPGFGFGKPAWADECLARFPDNVFVQWVCDNFVQPKATIPWTKEGSVSTSSRRRNIMRAHFATYWGRYRGELAVDWISDMFQHSISAGFDAISLFGEVSPLNAGAELNYLALANYGSPANPQADLDLYLRSVAGPLLGGPDLARAYLRYARLVDTPDQLPDALKKIYVLSAKLPPTPARRWVWLANYLATFAA